MKQIEYITIEVLLKLIGGMIFLLRKIRGLTEKLMDDYERKVLKSSKLEVKEDFRKDENPQNNISAKKQEVKRTWIPRWGKCLREDNPSVTA